MGPEAAETVAPVLVYLYGPPAAGKLTIAEKLRELTGFRLFHNHLTVNAVREVFDFGTQPFGELIQRIRLEVFASAMRAGISLIFTNNSAWAGPDGHQRFCAFADHAAQVARSAGGVPLFVRVTAPLDVLESRVANESRRGHGKLLDAGRLRELVTDEDNPQVYDTDLVIDSGELSADTAAQIIAAAAQSAPLRIRRQ